MHSIAENKNRENADYSIPFRFKQTNRKQANNSQYLLNFYKSKYAHSKLMATVRNPSHCPASPPAPKSRFDR